MAVSRLIRKGLPPLAYVKLTGQKGPGGIFCSGYYSSLQGTKAVACEKFFADRGHGYVRFDKTGVGLSVDANAAAELSFRQWKDDLLTVLDQLVEGPQVC